MKKIIISITLVLLLTWCFWNNQKDQNTGWKLNLDNSWTLITSTGTTNTGATSTWTKNTKSWTWINEEQTSLPETSWLEKDIEEFNVNYKKALISTAEWSQISIGLTKNITEKWWAIISNYRWYKVKWFEKTIWLDDKLITIGINLLNASDYVTSWKMDLAHEELLKVWESISKMREENGIKSIRDDMQTLQDKVQLIIKDWDVKDTNKFKDLATQIEKLTSYNTDNKEYKQMLWDLEKLIINVSNLTWQDYKNKLIELKTATEKFYVTFG